MPVDPARRTGHELVVLADGRRATTWAAVSAISTPRRSNRYPIDRFTMEVKRQLDVLDRHLADHQFMAGEEYRRRYGDLAVVWKLIAGGNAMTPATSEKHTYTRPSLAAGNLGAAAIGRGARSSRWWQARRPAIRTP